MSYDAILRKAEITAYHSTAFRSFFARKSCPASRGNILQKQETLVPNFLFSAAPRRITQTLYSNDTTTYARYINLLRSSHLETYLTISMSNIDTRARHGVMQ